jgi:Flp pilus assembly protein protease CpaA
MLHTLILILGIAAFAVIAYGDVRTRRIPNEFAVAIGVLGLARLSLAGDPIAALYTLAAAAAVFAAAFLLFSRGLLGGGDVKLLAATVLLVGYHELLEFLLIMSLCGAFLAVCAVAAHKLGPSLERIPLMLGLCGVPLQLTAAAQRRLETWLPRLAAAPAGGSGDPRTPSVPYGVAIAAAGAMILVLQTTTTG